MWSVTTNAQVQTSTVIHSLVPLIFNADPSRTGPAVVNVWDGDTIILLCNSIATTKWSFNDGLVRANSNVFGYNLIIRNVQLSNNGSYECVGMTEEFESFVARQTVVVTCKFEVIYINSYY